MGGRVGQQTGMAVVAVAAIAAGLLGCSAGEPSARRPAAEPSEPPAAASAESAPPGAVAAAARATRPDPRDAAAKLAAPGKPSTKIIANFDGPISVPTGQSILLQLSSAAERVAIADPEVAEVVLINPREILINGKGRKRIEEKTSYLGDSTKIEVLDEGKTSLIVWDKAGNSDVRTLYVNKARTEQIMLEVTVADLNRGAIEATGFDFLFYQGHVLAAGTQSKLFSFNEYQPVLNGPDGRDFTFTGDLALASDRISYIVRSINDDLAVFIELLQRESLAKILARPTILARSGEEAHFRVGGEIPIVYTNNNVATITFKEFGVIVHVTPSLADDGEVDLRVSTEVSQPVNSGLVTLSGTSVPEFRSRKAETRVKLAEGASLMIGGLYREDEVEQEDKTPYLGDIPYLGAFFRRTRFERSKNELLIVVKPRVVRDPSDVTPVMMPTQRPPLSRSEVRTKPEPEAVTRPRLGGQSEAPQVWPAAPEHGGLPRND